MAPVPVTSAPPWIQKDTGRRRRRAEAPRQSRAGGRPLAAWLLESQSSSADVIRAFMSPRSDDAGHATEGQAKFEFLTLKGRSSPSTLGSR